MPSSPSSSPRAKHVRWKDTDGDSATLEAGPSGSSVTRVRYRALWFEDGNIVLATTTLLFRVHRGLLARHSTVFEDLFSLPQPEEQVETYEGIPVVELPGDDSEDVKHLLHCIYDRT